MTIVNKINLANAQIASDISTIAGRIGDLTSLDTTAKNNVAVAINELHAAIGSAGASIDDTKGNGDTSVTWSADKIFDTIEAAKQSVKSDLTDGAPAALDTLNKLAAALNDDAAFSATLATSLNNKVDFATAQTLTAEQKKQACENIGVGDPTTDFKAAYETERGTL